MLQLLKGLSRWIARHALLFALIVAGLVAFGAWRGARDHLAKLANVETGIAAQARDQRNRSRQALVQARRSTAAALDAAIAERRAAKRRLEEKQRDSADWRKLVTFDAAGLLRNRTRAVEIAALDHQIAGLETLRDTAALRPDGLSVEAAAERWRRAAIVEARACGDAARRARALRAGSFLDRLRNSGERERLLRSAAAACERGRRALANATTLRTARRGLRDADARAEAAGREIAASLGREIAAFRQSTASERALAAWRRVRAELVTALLILIGLVLTPLAIRTLFYWVLAPIAARRPPIRLRPAGGPVAAPGGPSATSLTVRLGEGGDLLVKQGFLQSSAVGGRADTQWLLDARHPLSSIAAGLTFLTRFRGEAGDSVVVSAVDDPFAEVAMLNLPEGAACVLHPRSLVAVLQPAGRPLRVTSRWRLGSLHAWLTLQLRFLLFHGPARLVLKGGRGVRIERAERGRVFGQEQLLGYSAELAYSVTRAESFAPYLFGRTALLRDTVAEGGGVLVIEEAPMAGRGRGLRRGLEGAMDAMLKVIGI